MQRVETVNDLIKHLQENCNGDDKVYLKLWGTDAKTQVFVKSEDKDGYPLNGYIVITAHE